MVINIVATKLSDIMISEKAGANGVLLMSSFLEEGLTPSIGLIVKALNFTGIDVNVMVRPHSGDCCYSPQDMDVIVADICAISQTDANAIIIGLLDSNNRVNIKQLEMILPKLKDKGLIFSAAIDETQDPAEAAKLISQYEEVKGILTKGGKGDFPARMLTVQRMREAAPELFISVGGDISINNLADIHIITGTNAYHPGTGVRRNYSSVMDVDYNMARDFVAIAKELAYKG